MIFLTSNQDVVKHVMIRLVSYNGKDSKFFEIRGEKFSGTGLIEEDNRVSGRRNVPPLVPNPEVCTGWPKSHDTEKKLNISLYDLSKEVDFFINDRDISKVYIHMDAVGKNLH